MLLQKLKEYADQRMTLPPRLYSETPIRYVIELDKEGRLLNPQPTDTADPASPRTKRGQRFLAPEVQHTSGIKPLLLAAKADYTLGYTGDEEKSERARLVHQSYLELLEKCSARTREPAVRTVLSFLQREPLNSLRLPEDFDPSAKITFRVDGAFPIDQRPVQEFWAEEHDPAKGSSPVMQCLVCGQELPVLDRLQSKIKGVPGGHTSGTSIISANAKAFESYGLTASLIAPTCGNCGERFTKAANELLASHSNRIALGGAAFVFWTREDVKFDFFSFLNDPKPEQVKGLLESLARGGVASEVDDARFYATVLSGSGGRAVVRDWVDTTVGEVKRHLAEWHLRQRIVDPYGEEPRPLGLYALAAATVRDARKDLAPPTPRAMLHAALNGTPLPSSLLAQAARRNQAEQGVTFPRAALIKLVLASQQLIKEGEMVSLGPNNSTPAYLCGRLLAVLEAAQRSASPGINQTIVDRFYASASTTPNLVFPRLLQVNRHHLAKLRRDRRGAYVALERRLEEVMAGLRNNFPSMLPLHEQGVFALGYYHQCAYDRAQAKAAVERRRAGLTTTGEEELEDEKN